MVNASGKRKGRGSEGRRSKRGRGLSADLLEKEKKKSALNKYRKGGTEVWVAGKTRL